MFAKQYGIFPKILAIDDLCNRSHAAQILLDQNTSFSLPSPYTQLVQTDCLQLLGPFFSLLDPLYGSLQSSIPTRDDLKRVLIFFGGIDLDNYTQQVLNAISIPEFSHISFDVILGPSCPHIDTIQQLIIGMPNVTLHVGLPNLVGVISRSDLAIGAAGTTSWERTCLGLPTLLIPVADNQISISNFLSDIDAAILLDNSTPQSFRYSLLNSLRHLVSNPATLS